MQNLDQEMKDAVSVQYYNSGSAIAAGDIVEIGTAPNLIGGVAYAAIAASSWGTVWIKGRVKLAPDAGLAVGAALGAAYYRSASTNGITTTGTSVTAFMGYGASSILSTDASGTKVLVDLDGRARPRGES